jgi:hypothetical protein
VAYERNPGSEAGLVAEVGTPNPPPKPHAVATLIRLDGPDGPNAVAPPSPPLTIFP